MSFKCSDTLQTYCDFRTYPPSLLSLIITYIEGGQSLADAFLNEVVCDATRGVFIENRVHQSNLSSAASCLSLGGTELSNRREENMHTVRNTDSKDSQCLYGAKSATVCTHINLLTCGFEIASRFGMLWLQVCWNFVSL